MTRHYDACPIVADVRNTRQELFAEFGYDLYAYVADLKARQQEREARTGVCMPRVPSEPDAPRAGAA